VLPEQTEVPVLVFPSGAVYTGIMQELMALESAAMDRWRRGDPWGFTEICAEEVTYFDSGTPGRLNGLKALKAEYEKRAGKIHYDAMEFIDPKVLVHGDAAVLFYRFFSTRLSPYGSITSRTPWNCTEVYARQGETWKIVHTHWSLINGQRRNAPK
jgi:hypothetical protein